MRMNRRVGVIALLLVVSAAAIAVLSPGSSTQSSTNASVQSTHNSTAGMMVYIDEETGELVGTPPADAVIELDAEMANTLRRDDEGLVQVTHPNGAVSLDLQGRYGDVSVVRIDENGAATYCNDSEHSVVQTLTDTTTPTGPEVK
jgi:hypothetical protein